MTRFANGEEAIRFQNAYCNQCVHRPLDEDDGECPVLFLHGLWNYDTNEVKLKALNTLIPDPEDPRAMPECSMFVRRKGVP